MIHSPSLGKRFKSRERKSVNLGVDLLQEVELKGDVDLPYIHWPPIHANLLFHRGKVVQVGTVPTPMNVVKQGILRPPVIRLVEQLHKVFQLCGVKLFSERFYAEDGRGGDIRSTHRETKGKFANC